MGRRRPERFSTTKQTTLDGAGAGSIRFAPNPGDEWELVKLAVQAAGGYDASPDAVVDVYVGPAPVQAEPRYWVLGTRLGAADVADGDPPQPVRAGQDVLITWTGAAASIVANAVLELDVIPR